MYTQQNKSNKINKGQRKQLSLLPPTDVHWFFYFDTLLESLTRATAKLQPPLFAVLTLELAVAPFLKTWVSSQWSEDKTTPLNTEGYDNVRPWLLKVTYVLLSNLSNALTVEWGKKIPAANSKMNSC